MANIVPTSNGVPIDMEALKSKNEKTVAVGNMRVNARGDELSPTTGKITKTRNQRMTEYYKLHSTVPKPPEKSRKSSALVEVSVSADAKPPIGEKK